MYEYPSIINAYRSRGVFNKFKTGGGGMPECAKRGSSLGPIVYARDCTIKDRKQVFYCSTKSCPAKMELVDVANPENAYFRTCQGSPNHVSDKCIKCNIKFDETQYEEKQFDKGEFFNTLLGSKKSIVRGNTGENAQTVGGSKKPITTVRMLYAMCIGKKKTDSYNGISINDLLADAENYNDYKDGIDQPLLVECTFYKSVVGEYALLMNYPVNYKMHKGHVKVVFDSEELFKQQFKKLKGSTHKELIVIAGEWKPVHGKADYESECIITRARQIYYV